MKGDPIIFMVRDKNCMVSVTIKDVHQKRIAQLNDNERSELQSYLSVHVTWAIAALRTGEWNRRR